MECCLLMRSPSFLQYNLYCVSSSSVVTPRSLTNIFKCLTKFADVELATANELDSFMSLIKVPMSQTTLVDSIIPISFHVNILLLRADASL